MVFQILAEILLVIHLAFILFVVGGGLLVLRWRWMIFLHIPAVIWGFLIEMAGWFCPLTTYEVAVRKAAGESGYSGGFIEHYLLPVIYPSGLTPAVQLILAVLVVVINLMVYSWLFYKIKREKKEQ